MKTYKQREEIHRSEYGMSVVASINLNKRVNNQLARADLGRWLAHNGVHILFAQEPWKRPEGDRANFAGLTPIGGNEKVFAWIDSRFELPQHKLVENFWLRIELGYLVVYNVYLDAYDQAIRASQLERLRRGILGEEDRPVIVVGDFNIAPTPTEGLFGGEISSFNSGIDREPLWKLIASGHLVDLGYAMGPLQWTIERDLQGSRVQFRCDLALASDYIVPTLRFHYDHSTRSGKEAFTDHSALLIDVPVTMPNAEHQLALLPLEPISCVPAGAFNCRPEKTAIHRKEPTPVARKLMTIIRSNPKIKSVLDYGCGYGEDVRFYRGIGLQAEGYDPHLPFGWSKTPTGEFDLVTVIFVLNVLPDPWARVRVLSEAAQRLSRCGRMAVVTRSPEEIRREAEKNSWPAFNDGYWSHEGRGTFQRGLSKDEILTIAKRVGLTVSDYDRRVIAPPGTTCVVLQWPDS